MVILYSGDGQPEVGYCEIFSLSQNILSTEIPSSTQVTTQNPRGIQKKSKAQLNQDQNNGQETLPNYCVSPQQVENRFQKVRFKKRMSRSWVTIFWNWLHLMKNPDKVVCEINLGIIFLVYSFSCSLMEFSRETCWAVGRIISLV